MASTRHSIILNITGNAKRMMKDLAKGMQSAGKQISGVFSSVNKQVSPDQLRKTTEGMDRAAKQAARATRARERMGVSAGRGIQAGVGLGEQIGTGGTMAGAGGTALRGIGGAMQKRGGRMAGFGTGVVAGGMAASFVGKMSDEFTEILNKLTQVGGFTGGYDIEHMMRSIADSAKKEAIMPSNIRNILAILSRTRSTLPSEGRNKEMDVRIQEAAKMGALADAFGASAESFATFVSFQKRFGTGKGLEATMARGLASGLKRGNIEEFLQGTMALQEQLVQRGIEDPSGMREVLTSFGKLSKTLEGKYGAQLAGGMQEKLIAAGKGGGGLLTTLLYGSLQRKGMGYYDIRRQSEKGLGEGNLQGIIDFVKSMGGIDEHKAEILSRAFEISFTNAERLLNLEKVTEADLGVGYGKIKEAKKAFAEPTVQERRRARVIRQITKEDISEIANAIETGLSKGIEKLGAWLSGKKETSVQRSRRGTAEMHLMTGGALDYDRSTMLKLAGRAKDVGKEFNMREAYIESLMKANVENIATISKSEQAAAFVMLMKRISNLIAVIEKEEGKPFDLNVKINNKKITSGNIKNE